MTSQTKFIALIAQRAMKEYLSSDECTEDLRRMRVSYGEEDEADLARMLKVQAPVIKN